MIKTIPGTIISLIVIIAIIIVTAVQHWPRWFFIGEFFAYMSIFSNLMQLIIEPRNQYAGRILTRWAYIFAFLFILSILALAGIGVMMNR